MPIMDHSFSTSSRGAVTKGAGSKVFEVVVFMSVDAIAISMAAAAAEVSCGREYAVSVVISLRGFCCFVRLCLRLLPMLLLLLLLLPPS